MTEKTKSNEIEQRLDSIEASMKKNETSLNILWNIVRKSKNILERLFKVDIDQDGKLGFIRSSWLCTVAAIILCVGAGLTQGADKLITGIGSTTSTRLGTWKVTSDEAGTCTLTTEALVALGSITCTGATAIAAVTTETNRAQVAEAALSVRIVTETNRAQVAEALLASTSSLVTETNRAQVAEAATASALVTETNRAQVAEAGKQTSHAELTAISANKAVISKSGGRLMIEYASGTNAQTIAWSQLFAGTPAVVCSYLGGVTNALGMVAAAQALTYDSTNCVLRGDAGVLTSLIAVVAVGIAP